MLLESPERECHINATCILNNTFFIEEKSSWCHVNNRRWLSRIGDSRHTRRMHFTCTLDLCTLTEVARKAASELLTQVQRAHIRWLAYSFYNAVLESKLFADDENWEEEEDLDDDCLNCKFKFVKKFFKFSIQRHMLMRSLWHQQISETTRPSWWFVSREQTRSALSLPFSFPLRSPLMIPCRCFRPNRRWVILINLFVSFQPLKPCVPQSASAYMCSGLLYSRCTTVGTTIWWEFRGVFIVGLLWWQSLNKGS